MYMKKALLLINSVSEQSTEDERDVLVQAEAVEQGMNRLGFHTGRLYCDLNLEQVREELKAHEFDLVFNLVETLDGKGALIHLIPFMLESMGIPFTGSPGYAMLMTTDKVRAKKLMKDQGIPTPRWFLHRDPVPADRSGSFILKPVWEDGSSGIDDASVVEGSGMAFREFFDHGYNKAIFMERFIDGREFNLTLIAGPEGPEVMPPAEMQFQDYPEGKPRILNYASKWETGSDEYGKTIRSFQLGHEDRDLVRRMREIALQCWEIFELRGYARVDFRVDEHNIPYVLEVNANPCISPDAGFVAACAEGGVGYTDMIERIINDL